MSELFSRTSQISHSARTKISNELVQGVQDSLAKFPKSWNRLGYIFDENRHAVTSQQLGDLASVRFLDYETLVSLPMGMLDPVIEMSAVLEDEIRNTLTENSGIYQAVNDPINEALQREAYAVIRKPVLDMLHTINVGKGIVDRVLELMLVNDLIGLGPVDPLWRDESVREIVINGYRNIGAILDTNPRPVLSLRFANVTHLNRFSERILRPNGRRVTPKTPIVRGHLSDLSRIHATETTPDLGQNINIRRAAKQAWTIEEVAASGVASEEVLTFIGNCMNRGLNMLLSGSSGAGKAIHNDTTVKVLRNSQIKSILWGDIQEGDQLSTIDNTWTPVVGVYPQLEEQVAYRIRIGDDRPLIVSGNHRFPVSLDDTEDGVSVDELYAMQQDGKAVMLHTANTAPLMYPPVAKPLTESCIDPYMVGVAIGALPRIEGMHLNEEQLIAMQEAGVYMPLMVKPEVYRFMHMGTSGVEMHTQIANMVNDIHTMPDTHWCVVGSVEDRQRFLDGLITGLNNHRTTGNELAIQLASRVASSLGVPWKVTYLGDEQTHFELHEDTLVSAIIERVPHYDGVEFTCIQVADDSHTYALGLHNVLHCNTTLLSALVGCYGDDLRLVTIEETLEMPRNPRKQWAAPLECRYSVTEMQNNDGSSDLLSVADHVRSTMRMNPGAIIVGEVSDGAAKDLCDAANADVATATTVHANDPKSALVKLVSLAAKNPDVSQQDAYLLVASTQDIVVQIQKRDDGSRRIVSIVEVGPLKQGDGGQSEFTVTPIFTYIPGTPEHIDPDTGAYVPDDPERWEFNKDFVFSPARASKMANTLRPERTWEELVDIGSIKELADVWNVEDA